jgi:hypothetical protein
MPSILFCTPCYGGMVTAQHFQSCMNLKEELTKLGVAHDWLIGWNESLITRARNEMTATFLGSEHSHMMWIDADIDFSPDDVAKLWNLGVEIAVGAYSMKRADMPLSAWRNGKLIKLEECPREPFEVCYAGTGFMLLARTAIEKLAAHSESYEGPHGRVPAIYLTPIHNDGFESEDYHMCRRWREIGGKIIVDPSIKLGHWGQSRYGQAQSAT